MKRIHAILGMAILFVASSAIGVSARSIVDNPNNKPYFGARVALDVTCPGDVKIKHGNSSSAIDLYNPGCGLSFGAIYNIPLYANLYFEPGLQLYYNTTGIDSEVIDADGVSSDKIHASNRYFGFRIPFVLGYHFDFRPCSLHVFTGPEMQVGLWGRERGHYTVGGVKESWSGDLFDGDLHRFELGWKIGAGLQIDHYYLALSGTIGMLNRLDKGSSTWHQNLFQLTLGYNF